MKTAEEYANEWSNDPEVPFEEIILKAQKEAYNKALEDAVENIKLNSFNINPHDDTCDGYSLIETSKPPLYTRGYLGYITGKVEIDKESILKLKK